MKKFFLFALSFLGLLLLLFAGLIWWLQAYLESEQLRSDLQIELTQRLAPAQFRIKAIDFDFLSGCDLKNIEITDPPPHTAENFLSVQKASLRYSFWSLFTRKLFFHSLQLNQPRIALRFYSDGTSNIPALLRLGSSSGDVRLITDKIRLHLLLKHLEIAKGDIIFINSEHVSIAHFEKVNLRGACRWTPIGAEVHGELQVDPLTLRSLFKITDLHSSFSYEDNKLTLPDLTAKAYGGELTGLLDADFEKSAFHMNLKLVDADIQSMTGELAGSVDWLEGKLQLTSDLTGPLRQPSQISGQGEFDLQKTALTKFKLIREVSQILFIPELEKIQFEHIQGTFKIENQKITFFNIDARSEPMQIAGVGTVDFDRQINFDVSLTLSPDLACRIPADILKQLIKRDDGCYILTFHVFGTLSDPKTNLSEKIVQGALERGIQEMRQKLPDVLKKKNPELYNILFKENKKDASPTLKTSPEILDDLVKKEQLPSKKEETPSFPSAPSSSESADSASDISPASTMEPTSSTPPESDTP